jgi:flagellar basal-body rod protein FlgC
MGFFSGLEISGSGLTAQRIRMNATSSNIANAKTTKTAQGGPYQKLIPILNSGEVSPPDETAFNDSFSKELQKVNVNQIQKDQKPPLLVHDPNHPDADVNGYVAYPDINVVEEMSDMITASRSYEANATAFENLKSMAQRALSIGR